MKTHRTLLISALLVVFACLGLGRFGFGMILPNMEQSLQITTTQSGFIGTANFFGYLIGIFFVSSLYKKHETSTLIFTALSLQAFSMIGMTLFSSYMMVALAYTFSGLFSAISNVAIMVYIAHIIPQNIRGKALGWIVTGNGFAIIFSGFYVPQIELMFHEEAWRMVWISFALITLIIAYISKRGLIYEDEHQHDEEQPFNIKTVLYESNFWKISWVYLVFGLTYAIFVTYFVYAVMDKYELPLNESGTFWSILGLMSLISGPIFGTIADKIGAYRTLIIIYVFIASANFILASSIPQEYILLSAILFGLSAWSIPSMVTLLTSIHFGKARTAQVFSMITIIFAVGQTIGPVLAGYIHDIMHSFDTVFLFCALLALSAALSAFVFSLQKR